MLCQWIVQGHPWTCYCPPIHLAITQTQPWAIYVRKRFDRETASHSTRISIKQSGSEAFTHVARKNILPEARPPVCSCLWSGPLQAITSWLVPFQSSFLFQTSTATVKNYLTAVQSMFQHWNNKMVVKNLSSPTWSLILPLDWPTAGQ